MATEKTVISIEVEGTGKAINSLKELKAELKAAQSAALNGDGKAAKRVAELKDKMDDLKDTTKSLQGSGVEKISSSFSLLGQGFKDFDTDKISTGFKGIGTAMKAIPIFLLIEGITYLIENWEELSKGNGLIAKSLQFLGSIFTGIIDVIYKFTDAIGLSNTALEKQGEAIKKSSELATQKLGEQNAAYDRQIAAIKATGKSAIEVEKAKQENIIKTNMILAKQIEAYVRAGGELDEEKRKQLAGNLEAIRAARATENLAIVADHKDQIEKYKQHLEKHLAAYKKRYEDQLKFDEDERKRYESNLAIRVQLGEKEISDREATLQGLQGLEETYRQQDLENLKAFNDKKEAEDLKNAQKGLETAQQGLQATQALSDTFFAIKMANVKKGSKEEDDAARKQFKLNKALSIANIVMSGSQSVLAITAVPDFTLGIASAIRIGAIALTTAAQVAKISALQFQSNSDFTAPSLGEGASSSGAPSTSGTPSIAPPPQNTTTFTGNNNNNFNTPPVKTYVVETDLRSATDRMDRIKEQATF